jgi:hypothetical protein
MVFNATFKNISNILWQLALLVGGNRSIRRKPLYPNTYNTPQTPDGRTGIAFIFIFYIFRY